PDRRRCRGIRDPAGWLALLADDRRGGLLVGAEEFVPVLVDHELALVFLVLLAGLPAAHGTAHRHHARTTATHGATTCGTGRTRSARATCGTGARTAGTGRATGSRRAACAHGARGSAEPTGPCAGAERDAATGSEPAGAGARARAGAQPAVRRVARAAVVGAAGVGALRRARVGEPGRTRVVVGSWPVRPRVVRVVGARVVRVVRVRQRQRRVVRVRRRSVPAVTVRAVARAAGDVDPRRVGDDIRPGTG